MQWPVANDLMTREAQSGNAEPADQDDGEERASRRLEGWLTSDLPPRRSTPAPPVSPPLDATESLAAFGLPARRSWRVAAAIAAAVFLTICLVVFIRHRGNSDRPRTGTEIVQEGPNLLHAPDIPPPPPAEEPALDEQIVDES